MAKFLSDRDATRLGPALNAIEALTQPKNKASRRRIRSKGGRPSRSYIKFIDEFTCDAWDSYSDFTAGEDPVNEGASVIAPNLTSNAFEEGDEGYADETTDSNGDPAYVVDAYLLV